MTDLRLEPLAKAHVPALQAMLDDPLIAAFTPIPSPPAPDQAERMLDAYAAEDREGYAAVDGTGEVVAFGMLGGINVAGQQCELGYMVAAHARGRGIATEVLRLLTERAIGLGMLRLELRISVGNEASERVAERNGYEREGVLRSVYVKPGVRADTSVWSRLS
jgi:RimJ/RimL family protein N-acetyltransferase